MKQLFFKKQEKHRFTGEEAPEVKTVKEIQKEHNNNQSKVEEGANGWLGKYLKSIFAKG